VTDKEQYELLKIRKMSQDYYEAKEKEDLQKRQKRYG
jgi:hypothetical protein